jgi:hypothetical protein
LGTLNIYSFSKILSVNFLNSQALVTEISTNHLTVLTFITEVFSLQRPKKLSDLWGMTKCILHDGKTRKIINQLSSWKGPQCIWPFITVIIIRPGFYLILQDNKQIQPHVMVHTYNPSTMGRKSSRVAKFKANFSYIARICISNRSSSSSQAWWCKSVITATQRIERSRSQAS